MINDGPNPKERVARVLAEEVAPALQMDGTDIEILDLTDGVLRVRLRGACGSCPHTAVGVVLLIEDELRKRVPEVEYLEVAP